MRLSDNKKEITIAVVTMIGTVTLGVLIWGGVKMVRLEKTIKEHRVESEKKEHLEQISGVEEEQTGKGQVMDVADAEVIEGETTEIPLEDIEKLKEEHAKEVEILNQQIDQAKDVAPVQKVEEKSVSTESKLSPTEKELLGMTVDNYRSKDELVISYKVLDSIERNLQGIVDQVYYVTDFDLNEGDKKYYNGEVPEGHGVFYLTFWLDYNYFHSLPNSSAKKEMIYEQVEKHKLGGMS